MRVKKVVAPTVKEATEIVKIEYGENAVILSTRTVNGPNNVKHFELTVGIEEEYDKLQQKKTEVSNKKETKETEKTTPTSKPKSSFQEELLKLADRVYGTNKSTIEEKLTIPNQVEKKKQETPSKLPKIDFTKEFNEIKDLLIYRDVNNKIADTIIEQLEKSSAFLNYGNLDNYVISSIASLITTDNFQSTKKDRAKLIGFVGPTGVGKTTTIAKLAVLSKLIHNLDVGLISIDTYRLGAIDQLRIFSEISNIDMSVAYDIPDLQECVEKYKKKNLIFIDTAGRSQNNLALLKETQKFLKSVECDNLYLVLSSTSTTRNLIDVAEKFKLFNYRGLIFTKLDEAVTFGNLLNVSVHLNTPIYYLTNGQVIPDDILAADSEFIAKMIYTGKIYK